MAEPKRIQVRDRFIEVLETIRVENGHYYTPDMVTKKLMDFYNGGGKVRLTAYPDEGGEVIYHTTEVDETFYMLVHCIIERFEDPHEAAERVLRDVRDVIDADSINQDAGYLGGICVQVVMDVSADMFTEQAVEDRVEWMQRYRVMISAEDFGEL